MSLSDPDSQTPEAAGSASVQSAVPVVIVSKSAYDSSDPGDIVTGNVNYVNALLGTGCYQRSELPPEAMQSFHTDYYVAEVWKGGHAQFLANSGWDKTILDDIRRGLAAMDAEPYGSIFARLCTYVNASPSRARAIAQNVSRGSSDPTIALLDEAFMAQDVFDVLLAANGKWLRSLALVRPVLDDEYDDTINRICDANPKRPRREIERRLNALKASLRNRTGVASRLLASHANCLPVDTVGEHGTNSVAPDGREGAGFMIQTAHDRKTVFVFDDVAYLCDTYLSDGRMLTNEQFQHDQPLLMDGDADTLRAYTGMSNVELARVSGDDINSALETNARVPVVMIAQLLCSRLGAENVLEDVFNFDRRDDGSWLWALRTSGQPYVFGLTGDAFVLTLPGQSEAVATLSIEEIEAAARGLA